MNFKNLLSVVALALSLGYGSLCADAQTTPPKREMRSTWFTTHMRIDWPKTYGTSASVQKAQKAQIDAYLDIFQQRGLNNVCFQVRALADAMYQSSYEPWSAMVSGTRGTSPGWDPLAYVVEECHKRGMECYAWINPFRQRLVESNYTTQYDKDWANQGILLTYNTSDKKYTVFNPGLKAARDHVLKVIKEIYTKYNIDGMLFDDYFYPNNIPETSAAADYNLWKANGNGLSFGDWRRENINQFMRELEAQVNNDRPDLRFGVSPAGVAYLGSYKYGFSKPNVSTTDWQYGTIYSDPIAWLADGSIDFISPQLYWPTTHSTAPFGPLSEWWSDVANHFNRHFFGSLGAYRISDGGLPNNSTGFADIAQQVRYTRQHTLNNAAGQIYYSSKYFDGDGVGGGYTGLGQHLKNNVYQRPALTPEATWKEHPTYSAPSSISRSGATLNWSAVAGARSNSIIRYTVYAIPKNVTIAQAQAADGDGINAQYLLGISYSTSYNTKLSNPGDYWYAVCVFDGYGHEYTPAILDYPMGVGEATTLVSPQNGATVEWNTTFTWTNVSNANFSLRIATDSQMGNIVKEINDIASTSYTLDLGEFTPGATLYWDVVSHQPNHMPATSSVRRFKVPALLAGVAPTLTSPANGATVSDEFSLACSSIEGATYTFEVSSTSSFQTVVLSRTSTTNSVSVATSQLGLGTWYWRVKTAVPHHNDGVSASRTFVIKTVDVGNIESGYQIKRDNATYANNGTLSIENLWTRATFAPYNNYAVANDGSFNRGIAIDNQFVYISGRSSNTTNPDRIYLSCYSLTTGEHIKDIILSDNGKMAFYPCNDVIRDSAGHLCITNLSIKGTAHIEVMLVDLETGQLTSVATVAPDGRVDHVGIYGDVTGTENWYLFAAVASDTKLYRWTIKQNRVTNTTSSNVTTFVGYAGMTSFGVAPKCFPLDENRVFVDGSNTGYTLYNVTTGEIVDSFLNNRSLSPTKYGANGACRLQMGDNLITVYSSEDYSSNFGHQYNIVKSSTASWGITPMRSLWTVPANGLGTINSTTTSAPCDAFYAGNGVGYVAMLATGNGIAVYRITDSSLRALRGDVNRDGIVNSLDLGVIINMILGLTPFDNIADLNNDNNVNSSDIGALINIIINGE